MTEDEDGAASPPLTYIHIGFEKTGTTTIQAFMARNRQVFDERHLLYPTSVGRSNHLRLPAFAQRDDRMDDTRARYVSEVSELSGFRESVRQALRSEVEAAGSKLRKVVFSNEHLSARLTDVAEVERVVGLVATAVGGPIRVVAYVREQGANMRSSYSTNLRHGRKHPPATDLSNINLSKYDYAARLEPWLTVLGEEHVTVRVFDPRDFVQGDLLHDFVEAIDEPWPADAKVPSRKNEQLDATSMEFLRTFNATVPEIQDDGAARRLRGQLAPVLEAISDGPPLKLDEQLLRDLRDHVAPSNRSLAQRFLGRDELFRNSDSAMGGVPWGPLTADEFMWIFVRVWAMVSEGDL